VDENTENLKELARAFSESFLHSESVKIFEDLIERNVDIKDVLEYYLYSLYETGEYEKIIELPGDVPEDKESVVDFFKGLAYEKLGETNKALEILNEIYEKSPDFMDIEERLRKLKGEEIVEKAVEEEVEKVAVVEEPEEIIEEVVEEFKEEVPERVVEPVPEKKEKKGLNERIAIIY
jgi:tetratricopeptide (TPR) repeat protein